MTLKIYKMKNKNAAILLMISSIFWILSDIYWSIQRFTGSSWEYYKEEPADLIISTLMIIVPISLLIFSIALINNKSDVVSNDKEEVLSQGNEQNLTVGDWLVNFLITIIPLVGFIFIIIWANDDKNKIRKNWAVASLIWSGIIFVLSIFLYATIFAAIMNRY